MAKIIKYKHMKKITIKNGHLDLLFKLMDKPRHGKEARVKNRFLQLIVPRIKEIEIDRIKILESRADKKDGKAIMEEGSYSVNAKNLNEFRKEYTEILMEDLVIDVLPSNQDDLKVVKVMLENDTTDLTTDEGAIYDYILKGFEDDKGK